MTHPVLIRLEELVNLLAEGMRSREDPSGADLVNAAREYAEACATVNARLQTCLDILGKGRDKEHQALMAATRQPDLLDACAVLSELQTDDYAAFCRRNHLPAAPLLNERAKQEIDPLYARAGTFQKKLRMEFSAANSKRDFREALEIARQLARVDPSDPATAKQVAALEDRLVREVVSGRIAPALDKGDDEAAVTALAEIEAIAPGRQPRTDERLEQPWLEAIAVRKAIEKDEAFRNSALLLNDAVSASDTGHLDPVIEILARIGEQMARHSFELPSDRAILFGELCQWRDDRLRKARVDSEFEDRLDGLRVLIKQIIDKEFRNTVPTYEENRADTLELQRVWKEIAEFRKPVEEELQEKARKLLADLHGKIDRNERARRRNLIMGGAAGLAALIAAIVVAMMFLKAGSLAGQLLSAQEDGRAGDLAKLLDSVEKDPPSWRSFGKLPRIESNARTWLGEQQANAARLQAMLSTIRDEFGTRPRALDWTPASLGAVKTRLDELAVEVAKVNRDDRIALDDAVASLSTSWDGIADTVRNAIMEDFHTKVGNLDRAVREELGSEVALAKAIAGLEAVNAQIAELDTLAAIEIDELKPSAADLTRFGVLKERVATLGVELNAVGEILRKCDEADQLSAYLAALRKIGETSFLSAAQKLALGDLLAVAESEERVLRDILMPGDFLKWKTLSERTVAPEGYPDDISPDEESLYLGLRDDESLSEVYLYRITEGAKSRTIYSRGSTLETADLSSAGSLISEMRGSEVYDPDGASANAVSFTERRYRIERGSNFTRGSLPIGGALSPESAFFNVLGLPGYVREDFSAFSRPGLELAEKILKGPDTVSPLFRAYLFLGVGRLMSSRPEKWLVDYCQFGEDLETIRSIAGAAMTGADWCSSEKNAAVAAKLATFFSERKDPDYLDRAKAVYGFHARLFTGGIAFSGHLDHEGRVKTPRPVDVASTLWGFDPALQVRPLFQKDAAGEWKSVSPAAEFTPLFHLRVSPEITWEEVAKANSVDWADPSLTRRLPAILGIGAKSE
jgi:hypothetical protein